MEKINIVSQNFFPLWDKSSPSRCFSVLTDSTDMTEAVGAALGHHLEGEELPSYIAMYGDLGVGKTAFVRGMASVLAPGRPVRSPTFSLVNEYRVPGRRSLYHFDLYRIESEDDLYSMGFDDYLDAGICVAEWCEKIPYALPSRRIEVCIRKVTENINARHIQISVISQKEQEASSC